MSDEWLTPQQAAERLGCTVETVRGMLRCELLGGEKEKGQWRVKAAKVEELQAVMTPASVSAPLCEIDVGMVEVSIALAGIAGAVAGFLPDLLESAKPLVAILGGVTSILSSYSALWLLARYCLKGESAAGLSEVAELVLKPGKVGPYWFLALGLLFWLVLSIVIFQLLLAQVL